ncbi:MAG TPA: hypothetical protein VGO35_04670 [Gammaproteobacteria bacterium]|jgi:hypothetical protein|nr:hypothetical protein [Gammaproteobacteria bacterium]
MRRYGTRFARERHAFERWAAWSARQWDESLGLPRVTWLAKLVQYGERLGVMHAAAEMLPPDHSDAEAVNGFMEWLRGACPPIHAALMARHRGICLERKTVGGPRPRHGVERYYAECLLDDGSPAGVQRFRRLCEQGYRLYRDGAGRTKAA